MEFPKTFAAAKRAEKSQWAIGDALLEEIGPPRAGAKQDAQFTECARELAEAGMQYKTDYLRQLRNISHKFNLDGRTPGLTTEQAIQAGSPRMLAKAQEVANEEGKPLTKRFISNVRKTHHALDRAEHAKHAKTHGVKVSGRTSKPMPTPKPMRPKSDRPVSEVRRMANVLDLHALAGTASKAGKSFVQQVAGFDLSADEREELIESIDRTLDVWKTAREAVQNPISAGAEEFLRSNA